MNNEHNVAITAQITTSVTKAASQRGTRQPRTCSADSHLTSGEPMTASTAEMRI